MGESVTLSGAVAAYEAPAAAYSALPQITPSPEALQVLNQFSEGGLSRDQVSALSAAVAQTDAGIQNPVLRQATFGQISGLGMFFRNTDPDGFPRWPVMTALRAYGLNLSVPAGEGDAAVARRVQQVLSDVSQQSRGISAQQAVAAVPQPVVLKVVSLAQNDSNSGDDSDNAASAAPAGTGQAPAAIPAPVVTAVDKLV